jgi:hypothetical protein
MAWQLSRISILKALVDCSWVDATASNRTPPTRANQRQTKTVYEKEWSFLPQTQSTFTLKQGTFLSSLSLTGR